MCPVGWAGHAHEQCFQCEFPLTFARTHGFCKDPTHFSQMSARKMMTALWTKPVSLKNALTLARGLLVGMELFARPNFTGHSAAVPLVYKEIL